MSACKPSGAGPAGQNRKENDHEDFHQQPVSAIQFALITAGWLSEWQ
jgi:hypothetical protein